MVVRDPPNKVPDNSGEEVAVTCVPTSSYNFTIGDSEVECHAVDNSGNKATCRFRVSVNGMHYK